MDKLDKRNIEDVLSLTSMQEGMLYHYLKAPGNDHYFEQLSLEISGEINADIFEKAWNFVVETNEMLRTLFRWEKVENPIQIILKKHPPQLRYHDLTAEESTEKKNQVEKIKIEDRREKFDLQEVPFRVTLCKIEADRYVMMISNHHILYDGWSNGIILKEFLQAYDAFSHQKSPTRPGKGKFKEFVDWVRNQNKKEQEKYWQEYLQDYRAPIELPGKLKKREKPGYTGKYDLIFPGELASRSKAFLKALKLPLSALIYSAWGILLQKYNDCEDIVFDTSVSVRPAKIKGIEDIAGLFINTVPLRIKTHPKQPIKELLAQTSVMLQEREQFAAAPVLNIENAPSDDGVLFNSVLVIENYPWEGFSRQHEDHELALTSFSVDEITRYDLTAVITSFDDIALGFTYDGSLFDEQGIKKLAGYFFAVIKEIITYPGKIVREINISPQEERHRILSLLNNRIPAADENTLTVIGNEKEEGGDIEEKLKEIWAEVLHVDKTNIGLNTSFFDFGGQSLKASALAVSIHKHLNVRMPFGQIFKLSTIKEQAKYTRELRESRYTPIKPAEKKEYYVLSPAQKRIFILQHLEESIAHYNGVEVFILEGKVEPEQVENTFKKLIERHESLRTFFELIDGTPVQRVHQTAAFKIHYGESQEEQVPTIIQDFIKPFPLDQAPLCRVKFLKVGEKRFALIVDMHHIISDGISIKLLLEDFQRIYENHALPGVLIQYKDYTDWLNSDSQKENLKTQEKYWMNTFAGEILPLNLYTDYSRPQVQDYKGEFVTFNFAGKTTRKLSEFAIKTSTTIYMVLFSAFKVLLWKLTGQEDIVIGTPTAGRSHPDLERIVGMFVNTLAIRSFPGPGKTFMQFAAEVKDNFLKAYENQDYPFETLIERLGLQGERSRNPLFNVWVNSPYLGKLGESEIVFQDIKLVPYKFDCHVTAFDLSLFIREYANNLELKLEYKTGLFKRSTSEYLLREYVLLVEEILSHPHLELKEFNIFDRQRIALERKNAVPGDEYTKFEKEEVNRSITSRFEKQVEKYPDRIAIRSASGRRSLTYNFLDRYANRVARTIMDTVDDAAQTAALLFGHEMEMIPAILGVLKSGRAYAPLDPTYPEERLLYMLENSGAKLLVTTGDHIPLARSLRDKTGSHVHILDINAIDKGISKENPLFPVEPGQSAYLLYTSGSTGKPKGVLQLHRNVLHFIRVFTESSHTNPNDYIPLVSNYCFDGAVIEMFLALLNGASLHFYDIKSEGGDEPLARWLQKRGIDVFHSTPTLYRHLVNSLKEGEKISSIRMILLGGEAVNREDIDSYRKYFSRRCLFLSNMGMTEATTNINFIIDWQTRLPHSFVPLGSPVEETRYYILDENHEEARVLQVGELVIKSNYLAPGYWKLPGETREKFREDPLTGEGRVYYTGDLVRLHPDGEIEFMGRRDFQVKIRGFRVELGEIENILEEHGAIKRAVVVDRTAAGRTSLYAYVEAGVPLSAAELKGFLAAKLPEHLIPSFFLQLEKFPLTPSGKIDRTSLPDPEAIAPGVSAAFSAPRTKSGKVIADLWKEILHLDKVGLDDNFFESGGTSLDIIRLQTQLRESLGKEIKLGDLLANPTIRYLSQYYDEDEAGKTAASTIQGENDKAGLQYEPPGREKEKAGAGIAVIGMNGRFPGAGHLDEFWDNLKAGRETISFFSDGELTEGGVVPGVFGDPDYVKAKGCLEEIEYFDAHFFGYSPREAEVMDPQLRILHECSWEALENAGYNPGTYNGIIGFYIGAGTNLYWMSRFFSRANSISGADRFAVFNLNSNGSYGTRVAYKFDLKGPCFSLDTACSTSLVSIHLACQGLSRGECDVAAAGGISISLPPRHGYRHQEGMIHSADGHCRTFSADATGTVFGDGVGIVVLKPLNRAIADRDSIYAVIKGSAINNDGSRKLGYTAPGVEGQARVIREAIQNAGIEPESIGYIEAHGTGTALGDPHEIEALTRAFNTGKRQFCKIGSVKSNVGHLDAAAGAAGFIKTVLALKNKLIPPSLHFKTPNPEIDFEQTPFSVNTTLVEWESKQYPLRAGVSSFGIGGTNAHVILEEAPAETLDKEGTRGLAPLLNAESSKEYQLILLSAKTRTALEQMTSNLAGYFQKNPNINLTDAAYTLQVGRKPFNYRSFLVVPDVNEAIENLSGKSPGKVQSHLLDEGEGDKNVVFMFSGQGSQYVDMGLELYQLEPVFREEMDRCFGILNGLLDYDIKEILYPLHRSNRSHTSNNSYKSYIHQTEIAQPLLFAFEYALAKLLMKWGIKPDAMIGHSIGEYVAACLAGVFSLENALSLVVSRGKLMQKMPHGSMSGVPLSEKELTSFLNNEIALAAVNSPSDCVVSAPLAAIETFEKILAEKKIKTTRLHTSHAFHSKMMDPILKDFETRVKEIELNAPQIPYISNLSGNWITDEQATDPHYWAQHTRQTVRFADGVNVLLNKKNSIFIEVGPNRMLSSLVKKSIRDHQTQMAVNLVRHPREEVSDLYFLLNKIGRLWIWGVEIDWQEFDDVEKHSRISLPAYPFERRPYWTRENMAKPVSADLEEEQKLFTSLPVKNKDISKWFYVPSWKPSGLNPASTAPLEETSAWLVFIDKCAFSVKLIRQLVQLGHHIITVRPGPEFIKEDDESFRINPGEPGDYEGLIEELSASGRLTQNIVHLWNINQKDDGAPGIDRFEKYQDLGFFSLLFLAQAIAKKDFDHNFHITVLTNSMFDVTGGGMVYPEKATLLGPIKVIPQEYPQITCRSIDIDLPAPGSWQEKKMVDRLAAELVMGNDEPVVAYRGNCCLVQSYERVQSKINEPGSPKLKKEGVYLITGGPGKIGLTVAEHLAKNWQAKLILTGRSPFPAREQWETWLETHGPGDEMSGKIRKVKKIEDLGSEVIIAKADVSHLEEMKAVLSDAEKRFGKLDGLLHVAGIAGEESMKSIKEINKEKCDQLFRPKTAGLFVLEKILKGKNLDFCLLFSSISAILGGIGLIAYSAANIFMDAFAQKQNDSTPLHWISVNWDLWKFTQQKDKTTGSGLNLLELAIEPGEGVEALNCILSRDDLNQVVVSTGKLDSRIETWIKLESSRDHYKIKRKEQEDGINSRPLLPNQYVEPGNDLERMITGIWEDYFGIDGIGIHDNFFDLGATSLDLIRLNDKLRKIFKKELPIEKLFTYPTIYALSEYLAQMGSDKRDITDDQEREQAGMVIKGKNRLKRRKMSFSENIND